MEIAKTESKTPRMDSMRTCFEAFHNLFLDILFPISCLSCGADNAWLCKNCLEKIDQQSEQLCPVCEKSITPDGKTCVACKRGSSLDGLLVCASYKEKIISKLVHNFKYRFIENLSVPLGKMMTKKILDSSLPLPNLLLAVPLHPRRLRWRGFNQSLFLAKQLSQGLTPGFEIPASENILFRIRYTQAQMKIKNYHERKKNMRNAFSIERADEVKGKTIYLIDDIATTGATLFECAKILKDSGAREVFAVVIARQEIVTSKQ